MNYLLGTYLVEGVNPDEEKTTYEGILELTTYNNKEISAKWKIGEEQEQFGQGYIKKDKLIVDFYYYDDYLKKCNGQVIYSFLDNQILQGVWTEENSVSHGKENCYRINHNQIH